MEDPEVETASKNWLGGKKSFAKYLLRFDKDQARRIIDAYIHQDGPSRKDPIANAPDYIVDFNEVDRQIEEEFPKQRIGQCHSIWRKKKALLKTASVAGRMTRRWPLMSLNLCWNTGVLNRMTLHAGLLDRIDGHGVMGLELQGA